MAIHSTTTTDTKPGPAEPSQAPLLPASQLALIKATVPVLQQHGEAITKIMYDTLLAAHPALHDIFSAPSQATGRQPRALARAVLAYAMYIDDLPQLAHAVERIAQKHVSLFVRPEQYDVVGEHLIGAIRTVLGGEGATPEMVAAWRAAYGVLASVFIAREGEMYRVDAGETWAWTGWREFTIARRVVEQEAVDDNDNDDDDDDDGDTIVSLYLVPRDGVVPLPRFLPGQYVSLQVDVPVLGHKQSRQYSLSDAPGGNRDESTYYRVSIKRERNSDKQHQHGGLVSNLLHDTYHEGDTVRLSHPHGTFVLDPADGAKDGHPVVFISAGVGATPLVAMLKALAAATKVKRPVSWIHTSRTRGGAAAASEPFHDEVVAAVDLLRGKGVPKVVTHVHLTHEHDESQAVAESSSKRLDIATLDRETELFVSDARTEYFVCGPEEFMVQARRTLVDLGVGKERMYLELFTTGDVEDD